ncbi:telomeric repeat-binding factor 1 isoform X2 [Lampris incognitus]|uniref:telomeric repeat-binding factor 1 isoform X2 n=1 Tax=Lampris incognitus TaxID=2546036 RepID=UPI0024B50F34|nr:telomeric repeat-binding factor 1 isoform X2 [Lampris incognitus]
MDARLLVSKSVPVLQGAQIRRVQRLSVDFAGNDHVQKKMISSILTRVMHGQHLDTQFEEDDRVMPLMSAAVIWSNMRDTVADEHLFESIATLLIIQSSAVCLEKGERAKASFALTWLKENLDIPQNLQVKLSAICKKGDIYHPFLLNFSFSHLLEMVQTYLDAFQREKPSNFLLQAATKVALSSPEVRNDSVAQEESLADTTNKSTEDSEQKKKSCPGLGQKKKLLWMKNPELQQFVYCKNVKLVLEKLSLKDKNPLNFVQTLPETSQNTTGIKRTKKKWTWALDQKLVKGVRRHGEGKWSRILMDDDFEGRTGTMLKDRWRILKRK